MDDTAGGDDVGSLEGISAEGIPVVGSLDKETSASMRLLIVTSCTGEKARHHERGLTLEEALSEPKSKTLTPHGEAHGRQM
jgi:hypothetical protein